MKKHYKLPKIYRFITESFTTSLFKTKPFRHTRAIKIATVTLLGVVMLFLIGISLYDVYSNYQSKKKIDLERQEVIENIEKRQRIVEKYQDYRDGYFQLAILEYRLRNFAKSRQYLDKALELDPNFEKGRSLEAIITKFDK